MLQQKLTQKQEDMVNKWQKRIPPVRPSNDVVKIFEKNIASAIKNRADSVWGLLGCTPEIRTIAGSYKARIICMDQNPDAFYAYKVMSIPSPYEEFICINWLDLNYHGMFDIIIGDGVFSMLRAENHAKLLENIYNMVKPKGFVILRNFFVAPLVLDSVQKIFNWYRNEINNGPIITRQYLVPLWLNPDTLTLEVDEYQSKLLETYHNGTISDEEYKEIDFVKNPGILIQYTKKETFEQTISPFFEIEDLSYPGDYPLYINNPVYFLRKK